MDLKLDPYTIGGVIAISAGGYLIIKAYNNYSAVSVWNTIGMITVGSALAWGGVKIFSAKSTGEKKEQTKKIKADVTKAIAAVGEASPTAAIALVTSALIFLVCSFFSPVDLAENIFTPPHANALPTVIIPIVFQTETAL